MTNKILCLVQRTSITGVLAAMGLVSVATAAHALHHPNGLALDSAGNLYVANAGNVEQGDTGSVQVYSVAVKSTSVAATLRGTITTNATNSTAGTITVCRNARRSHCTPCVARSARTTT
jgi:hypothetical protein